jgi:hypothetical protein
MVDGGGALKPVRVNQHFVKVVEDGKEREFP